MDNLVTMLLIVFLLEQLALVAVAVHNAMTGSEAKKELSKVCQSFEEVISQQDVNRKVLALFNKRLTRQKTVIVTLYKALEGAAKGSTEEEILKELEKITPLVSSYIKETSSTVEP